MSGTTNSVKADQSIAKVNTLSRDLSRGKEPLPLLICLIALIAPHNQLQLLRKL